MTVIPFKLSSSFLEEYKNKTPDWGPLGEFTFYRTYSRKVDGEDRNEMYWETVKRVVESTFTIQKIHCKKLRLPWNNEKAQKSAQKMYEKMFNFKFTPPGRGFWAMRSDYIERFGSCALFNCAHYSTETISQIGAEAFCWTMDLLMLGVGVGFDTLGSGKMTIKEPGKDEGTYVIPDSREGWVESVRYVLDGYLLGRNIPNFDYSKIRPEGEPIKGFGGVASGPQPLIDFHNSVSRLLDSRIGEKIKSTDIVDIMCMIGKMVVAGNVRRSALLSLGSADDKEFIEMKDPDKFTDELMSHRWSSNNSIIAKVGETDYRIFVDKISNNGEPGFVWLDNIHKYGRTIDKPDYKDSLATGVNPCISPDTWIMTKEGPRIAKDLIGNNNVELLLNRNYVKSDGGMFYNGRKKLYNIQTEEGYEIKATKEHKFIILEQDEREWKEVSNIKPGDKIVLNNHRNTEWNGSINTSSLTFAHGYITGYFLTSGVLRKDEATIYVHGIKNQKICEYLILCMEATNNNDLQTYVSTSTNLFSMTSKSLCIFLNAIGITEKSTCFDIIEQTNSDFYRSFIQGIFDSLSFVNEYKETSIILLHNNLNMIKLVQRMLLRLGIISNVSVNKVSEGDAEIKVSDTSSDTIKYHNRNLHELKITKDNVIEYINRIGFVDNRSLNGIIFPVDKEDFTATIKSISEDEITDVVDIKVPMVHSFSANGFISHNCGEIVLQSGELCNVVEVYPARHETIEEFIETLKYAYLYAKTVTLIPSHHEETNAIQMKNRRLGISLTGIIDAFNKHGRRTVLQWADKGYNRLREIDDTYSGWLCIPKSIRLTTIKPSGSVSLLSGSSPGIHYPHSKYYIRRVRIAENSHLVKILRDAGYDIERDKTSPNTLVISFPVEQENFSMGKKDITVWQQVKNAADLQKYWSDNSISITVTFDPDKEKDQIPIVLESFEDSLKTISFLPIRDAKYEQMPYEEIDEETYKKMKLNLRPLDFSSFVTDKNESISESEKFCNGDKCSI